MSNSTAVVNYYDSHLVDDQIHHTTSICARKSINDSIGTVAKSKLP